MPLYPRTVTPITAGFVSFGTGGMPNVLNVTSGTSVTTVAGTIYWAAIPVLWNVTLTGIIFSVGSTGGTDKFIAGLYNSAGTLLANSDLAGITVGTANTKQKYVFASATTISGPGTYYVAIQSNGTTAKFLAFSNVTEGFVTGSTTGSFGTLSSMTPGTTYTASVGPYATLY